VPLGSISEKSISSSVQSGDTGFPPASSASIWGAKVGLRWHSGSSLVSGRWVAARHPLAIPMAAAFALHLASWAGCLPPQFGHFIAVCAQTFPVFPQVATLHLWSCALWGPAHMAQARAPFWHRNSECPHWLQMMHSVSALSGMYGRARNLLPATHISTRVTSKQRRIAFLLALPIPSFLILSSLRYNVSILPSNTNVSHYLWLTSNPVNHLVFLPTPPSRMGSLA